MPSASLYANGKYVSEPIIPTSITKIRNYAFSRLYLENIVIHTQVTSIGDYAFHGSHGFKSIIIPNSVKYIGKGAFYDCNLTFVVLPKSVAFIDEDAFSFCSYLTYITILGSPIIMAKAFRKCKSLKDIYLYGEDIPEIHNAFEDLDISVITLHIPSNAIEKYENAEPWCKFGNIVTLK